MFILHVCGSTYSQSNLYAEPLGSALSLFGLNGSHAHDRPSLVDGECSHPRVGQARRIARCEAWKSFTVSSNNTHGTAV